MIFKLTKTELILFFAALAIGLILLGLLYPRFGFKTFSWDGADVAEYDLLAENVVAGHGFTLRIAPPYVPSPARMPGYPLILAFSKWVSGGVLLVIFLQIAAYAASVLLTYRLARELLSQKLALISALIILFHVYLIFMSLSLMTESFFILFLLFSVYLLLLYLRGGSLKHLILSSFFLGFSALLRPTSVYLVVVWIALILFSGFPKFSLEKKKVFHAILVFFVFAALLFPWALRNKIHFGRWSLVSANAFGFYRVTPVQIESLKSGKPAPKISGILLDNFERTFKESLDQDRNYPDFAYKGYDKFIYADWFAVQNKKYIKENPQIFIKAVLLAVPEFLTKHQWMHPLEKYRVLRPEIQPMRPLYRFWHDEGVMSAIQEVFSRFSCGIGCFLTFSVVTLGRLFYLFLSIFAFAGMYGMVRKRETRAAGILFILIFFYFAAIHIILTAGSGQERYRLPIVPIMAIQALFGIQVVSAYFRKIKTRYIK